MYDNVVIFVCLVGPMKSLCCERVDDWRQKLSPLGLQCLELTGDSEINDFSTLHHVHVICTTPVCLSQFQFCYFFMIYDICIYIYI